MRILLEKLAESGEAGRFLLCEFYDLLLPQCLLDNAPSHRLHYAVLLKQLGYHRLANEHLEQLLSPPGPVELSRIMIQGHYDAEKLPESFYQGFSLLYHPDLAAFFQAWRFDHPDFAAFVLSQWMRWTLNKDPYFACYQLGIDFQRLGCQVEAQQAFRYSLQLNPHFGLADEALGGGDDPATLAECAGSQALISARQGRDDPPPSGCPSYLYRLLVKNGKQMIAVHDRQEQKESLSHYEAETLQFQFKAAAASQVRLKNKIARLNGGKRSGHERAAMLVGPGGNGDQIHVNGAVRYLATKYDQVYVGHGSNLSPALYEMYRDDPSIIWQAVGGGYSQSRSLKLARQVIGRDLYQRTPLQDGKHIVIPTVLYEDYGMDLSIARDYFYVEETEECRQLQNLALALGRRVVFVHADSSNFNCLEAARRFVGDGDDVVMINPGMNMYDASHPLYHMVEAFCGKAIFSYMGVMALAAEIHVIDSSFFALSHYLRLKPEQKVVCYVRPASNLTFYRDSHVMIPNLEFILLSQL